MNAPEPELQQALDALLGEASPEADSAELARLRSELGAAGDVLRARAFAHARDEARFVARVLARTTREDLSLAGDVRLFIDFLRARLKASRALRLVAASLALHVVAGPALAWWMLREPEPERQLFIRVEPARELPFEDGSVPSEAPDDELLAEARAREARENARATAHFLLAERAQHLPELSVPADASVGLAELARRVEGLRAGQAAASTTPPPAAETFAALMWLEGELDRLREHGASASTAARRLAAELAGQEARIDAPELATLVAAALQRAWSEGLIDTAPTQAPTVLSAAWFDALAAAGALLPGDEPEIVRRWVAAARAK